LEAPLWQGRGVHFRQIRDPDRLHALIEAILLIEVDTSVTTLLTQIVKTATELVGARYGALGVVTHEGDALSKFITFGLDDDARAAIGDSPQGRGLLGELIVHPTPLRVDDIASDERSVGFPANHPPMNRFLGAPVITRDGHVWGNLYVTDPLSGEPFTVEDEVLLSTFGYAAAVVVDQANLRRNLRELTLHEERSRMARDLHDSVIQRLFGVGLSLQMILPGDVTDEVQIRINRSLDELDETIHDIRTTIFEIDREQRPTDSLRSRVKQLTDEVGSRLGVEASLTMDFDLDDDVSDYSSHQVVYALREILSNVVRHSEATRVDVGLTVDGKLLVLTVHDNGVGIAEHPGFGRGLRNVTSRAEDLAGTCSVFSEPGGGTLVTWTAQRLA